MTTLSESQRRQSALIYGLAEQPLDWACGPRINTVTATQIYRNNLRSGVAQHLWVNFPITYRYLGPQLYTLACNCYLDTHPPQHPVFTVYAAHFPAFLLQQTEPATPELWQVTSTLAQIDFFYSNASQAGQQLSVSERGFRLWLAVHTAINENAVSDVGLYQDSRFDSATVLNEPNKNIALETQWQNGELVFTNAS